MTPDEIHDYDYELRNSLARLESDPKLRAPDRRLMRAFMGHIKALGVSTGRQAKYANMLMIASHMIRVLWGTAKRRDIEDLMDGPQFDRTKKTEVWSYSSAVGTGYQFKVVYKDRRFSQLDSLLGMHSGAIPAPMATSLWWRRGRTRR
jgi:hypothetical protein